MRWETGFLVLKVMSILAKWKSRLGSFWSELSRASSPDSALQFSHAQGSRGENESSFGLEMSEIGFSIHRLEVGQTLTLSTSPLLSILFITPLLLTQITSTPRPFLISLLTSPHPDFPCLSDHSEPVCEHLTTGKFFFLRFPPPHPHCLLSAHIRFYLSGWDSLWNGGGL